MCILRQVVTEAREVHNCLQGLSLNDNRGREGVTFMAWSRLIEYFSFQWRERERKGDPNLGRTLGRDPVRSGDFPL